MKKNETEDHRMWRCHSGN